MSLMPNKISTEIHDYNQVRYGISQDELIEVMNILERIKAPNVPFDKNKDQLKFAHDTIDIIVKEASQISEIIGRYLK